MSEKKPATAKLKPEHMIRGGEVIDGSQISANGTEYPAEAVHMGICPPELMELEISTVTLHEWRNAWVLGMVTGHALRGRGRPVPACGQHRSFLGRSSHTGSLSRERRHSCLSIRVNSPFG